MLIIFRNDSCARLIQQGLPTSWETNSLRQREMKGRWPAETNEVSKY
jgi:hypothetical protein